MGGVENAEAAHGEETSNPSVGGVRSTPSKVRRVVNILVAALVVVVLPIVLVGMLVGEFGSAATLIGLLLGLTGSKIGGTVRMLYVAPGIGVAAGLGAFTAFDWWWVVLLAATGVIAGAGERFGWFPVLLMVPYAATFVSPTPSGADALIYGVVATIATAYGIVLARRFSAPEAVDGDRLAWPASIGVAVVFGLVLGVSAAIGVALGWTEPYWVSEPVLILTLYVVIGRRERIPEKAIGTALGVAAAIPVAILALPGWAIALLASVAAVLALVQAERYWLMYGLYTFALVLSLAGPGQVATEAAHRGFEILTGIALLVVGLAVIHAGVRWLTGRDPQPELASNTK
jgi:hypothetical protein